MLSVRKSEILVRDSVDNSPISKLENHVLKLGGYVKFNKFLGGYFVKVGIHISQFRRYQRCFLLINGRPHDYILKGNLLETLVNLEERIESIELRYEGEYIDYPDIFYSRVEVLELGIPIIQKIHNGYTILTYKYNIEVLPENIEAKIIPNSPLDYNLQDIKILEGETPIKGTRSFKLKYDTDSWEFKEYLIELVWKNRRSCIKERFLLNFIDTGNSFKFPDIDQEYKGDSLIIKIRFEEEPGDLSAVLRSDGLLYELQIIKGVIEIPRVLLEQASSNSLEIKYFLPNKNSVISQVINL